MKKIPYGIINFKRLITEGYEYVDKTMYLSKLESVGETLVYLRPGRFGKSLFTSMLNYYYDVKSKDEFGILFKDTYVYNNPTPNKNNYYILKFDFSGISTEQNDLETLNKKFKDIIIASIQDFIKYYNIDYEIDTTSNSDSILRYFLSYFNGLNRENKLYIIIDEYDNFTNAILEGDAKNFIGAVGESGFVKSFYATIKIYVKEGVVGKVFITGICPITLNSMTTGFNIATDISTDVRFNSMIGLTHEEVKKLMEGIEKSERDELYNLMIEHYDGYLFSEDTNERVFNATIVMYFLREYTAFNKIPKSLYDNNIVVNYGKIDNLIKLQNNAFYKELIDEILKNESIIGNLKTQFNLLEEFTRDDIISLLYYFGYLTVKESYSADITFTIPNQVMKVTYSNYFLKLLRDSSVTIDNSRIRESMTEMTSEGKIDKITQYVSEILDASSNRIFINFDEKYVQIIYFALLKDRLEFSTHTEYECIGGGYADIFLEGNPEYTKHNIMIELKYIKKGEKNIKKLFKEKREEGIEQLKNYKLDKDNLKKYLVIFNGRNVELLEEIN